MPENQNPYPEMNYDPNAYPQGYGQNGYVDEAAMYGQYAAQGQGQQLTPEQQAMMGMQQDPYGMGYAGAQDMYGNQVPQQGAYQGYDQYQQDPYGQYSYQQNPYQTGQMPGQGYDQQAAYQQQYQADPYQQAGQYYQQNAYAVGAEDPYSQYPGYGAQQQQGFGAQQQQGFGAQQGFSTQQDPYRQAQQGGFADQQATMPSQQAQAEGNPERDYRHAQIRSSAIYGPKELHSPKIAEVEKANSGISAQGAQAVAQPTAQPQQATAQPQAAAQQTTQQPQQSAQGALSAQIPSPAAAPAQSAQQGAQAKQPAGAPGKKQPPKGAPKKKPAPKKGAPGQKPGAKRPQGAKKGTPAKAGARPKGKRNPALAKPARARKSFILGILSIVFGFIPPAGIVLAIFALKIANDYKANGGRPGKADSGRIFGLVGLVFSGVVLVFYLCFIAWMVGALTGNTSATAMINFFNSSPLGSIIQIPIPQQPTGFEFLYDKR